MTNPMINCFVCGSWIKSGRNRTYKCPKCKATYQMSKDGKIERIYKHQEHAKALKDANLSNDFIKSASDEEIKQLAFCQLYGGQR